MILPNLAIWVALVSPAWQKTHPRVGFSFTSLCFLLSFLLLLQQIRLHLDVMRCINVIQRLSRRMESCRQHRLTTQFAVDLAVGFLPRKDCCSLISANQTLIVSTICHIRTLSKISSIISTPSKISICCSSKIDHKSTSCTSSESHIPNDDSMQEISSICLSIVVLVRRHLCGSQYHFHIVLHKGTSVLLAANNDLAHIFSQPTQNSQTSMGTTSYHTRSWYLSPVERVTKHLDVSLVSLAFLNHDN